MSDLGGEGLSYEEWQLKRIKDEVKSFMKQLITEVSLSGDPDVRVLGLTILLWQRNDDYTLVANAFQVASHELKVAFGVDDADCKEESARISSNYSKSKLSIEHASKQALEKGKDFINEEEDEDAKEHEEPYSEMDITYHNPTWSTYADVNEKDSTMSLDSTYMAFQDPVKPDGEKRRKKSKKSNPENTSGSPALPNVNEVGEDSGVYTISGVEAAVEEKGQNAEAERTDGADVDQKKKSGRLWQRTSNKLSRLGLKGSKDNASRDSVTTNPTTKGSGHQNEPAAALKQSNPNAKSSLKELMEEKEENEEEDDALSSLSSDNERPTLPAAARKRISTLGTTIKDGVSDNFYSTIGDSAVSLEEGKE